MGKLVHYPGLLGSLFQLIFWTFCISPAKGASWEEESLESFFDGVMTTHMRRVQATAGTLAVVKDGRILLTKGYGVIDLDKNQKVDPVASLFRIGSVSKLFTYTAIMQLYEQGKIDLDENVNAYLREFSFPETFEKSTTVRHLMTHTSGLEASLLGGLFSSNKSEVRPILQSLRSHTPAQVRAPGMFPAYSNFGVTVLGRIVENISGLSFCQYVKENIYKPLEMEVSDFCESERLVVRRSVVAAYALEDGMQKLKPFEYIGSWSPAGAMSSSAQDMANFMAMHLGEGSYRGEQLLKPETIRLMHSTAISPSDRISGMAYGFIEADMNGYRALTHAGATNYFFSYLFMIPDHQLGVFYSFTGGNSSNSIKEPAKTFMSHYFPDSRDVPEYDVITDMMPFEGVYRSMRMEYSSPFKIAFSLSDISVTSTSTKNRIIIDDGENKKQYQFLGDGLFSTLDRSELIQFGENKGGQIETIHFGSAPYANFYRVPWFERIEFTVASSLICLTSFFLVLFSTKNKDRQNELPNLLVNAASISGIVFFGCLAYSLLTMNPEDLAFNGFEWPLKILMVATWFMGTYALVVVLFSMHQALRFGVGSWLLYRMMHIGVAAFVFWFSTNWNLSGV